MTITQHITTAEELLRTPGDGPCELVRGERIMMTPAGFEHGRIVIEISLPLGAFVKERGLGVVTGVETGFMIARDPDTVRAPDVAFVRAERVPASPLMGFFQGPPDLAVEVLSPSDRVSEVLAKVRDWLEAGCSAVWLVDPATQTVAVYRNEAPLVTHDVDGELTGGDVIRGFHLAVGEVFRGVSE
jgi:Uma2 family endonuclease